MNQKPDHGEQPYRAEFGAIHYKDAAGFLFTVSPPEFAEDVAAALNAKAENEALRAALEKAEQEQDAFLAVAPRLPSSFNWTGLDRLEDLFDAELRHESGKKPVDYLRAWLGMLRPFAFATRDDSWGEMEKLLCIVLRNYVRMIAAAEAARKEQADAE